MIGPKPAHLVERAAARLLEAGALEGSAAQLLDPDRARPPPFASPDGAEPPAVSVAPAVDLPAPDKPAGEVEEAGRASRHRAASGHRDGRPATRRHVRLVARAQPHFRGVPPGSAPVAARGVRARRRGGGVEPGDGDQRTAGRGQDLRRGQSRRKCRRAGRSPRAADRQRRQAGFDLPGTGSGRRAGRARPRRQPKSRPRRGDPPDRDRTPLDPAGRPGARPQFRAVRQSRHDDS